MDHRPISSHEGHDTLSQLNRHQYDQNQVHANGGYSA